MSDAQALIAEVEAAMARVTPGPWMWAVLAQKYLPRLVAELRAAEARDRAREGAESATVSLPCAMITSADFEAYFRAVDGWLRAHGMGSAEAADRAAFDAELSAFVNRCRDD